MPHKIGKKWKWGNIERSSKEDLRKTIYGIWMKNGAKGSFSKFWKTGKTESENDNGLMFKKVPRDKLVSLLDEIETYSKSTRFNRVQFEKYLGSDKMIDSDEKSMYYGLFSTDGRCLALSYLNKTPKDCVLVAQISCVIPGYGRVLLNDIIKRSNTMWLAADPTADASLLEYYRTFGLEETSLKQCKWANGKEEYFFFKADGEMKDQIMQTIKNARQ